MIKIIKNNGQVMRLRNGDQMPKYLLQAEGKHGRICYAKIGIREIWYYICEKIRGRF